MDRKGKVPFLNGAAMIFEANNSFIAECILKFNEMYNPKRFGTVGPELLWKTYQYINNSNSDSPILPHILESKVFYPVRFRSHTLKTFFAKVAPPNQLPWFDEDTIGVHFWGHLSTRFDILKESKGGSILENCDNVEFLKSLTQKKKNGSNVDINNGATTSQAGDNDNSNASRKKRKHKNKKDMLSSVQGIIAGGDLSEGSLAIRVESAIIDGKHKSEFADRKKGISSVSAGGLKGKKIRTGTNGWFP